MTEIPFDRTFWSDVLRRVSKRTRGHPDAEDLVHSAYLRFDRYTADRAVENPAAFLVQAAVNIQRDDYRREKTLGKRQNSEALEGQESFLPLQDEVLAARARLARVTEGIGMLSPRTREVFLLHRLENVKYHEIARRLNISESAVEKHIAKAMLFLRAWAKGW